MTEHAQNDPLPESLAALAKLLDKHASGTGRITPRPRGLRLSPETRSILEAGVTEAENVGREAVLVEELLIFGNGCYAVGRHEEASESYLTILNDQPSNAEARFNLGLTYLRLRSPQDAVREFTNLLVQQPLLAEAFYQRGNGNDDLGETDQALADYSRAIELS
ncbi:MAG: tetratricopeptide repeat protein, partial [bacterium]